MDAFEKEIDKLDRMDENKTKIEKERLRKMCLCPDCPTYNECAMKKEELIFCIEGRSGGCVQDELGCICPDCPVAVELELPNLYYCTRGSEKEMR